MKTIYKKRLLKLAKHLRSGKLGHKKFDFAHINAEFDRTIKAIVELGTNGCGTLGCALGECPIAFPRAWRFRNGQPRLRRKRTYEWLGEWSNARIHAESFFGIDHYEATHLFAPNQQVPRSFGGRVLGERAKPESVAANIEAFVTRKEKQ